MGIVICLCNACFVQQMIPDDSSMSGNNTLSERLGRTLLEACTCLSVIRFVSFGARVVTLGSLGGPLYYGVSNWYLKIKQRGKELRMAHRAGT